MSLILQNYSHHHCSQIVLLAGCTKNTYQECVTDLIFGLPPNHWCYVQYIQIGCDLLKACQCCLMPPSCLLEF